MVLRSLSTHMEGVLDLILLANILTGLFTFHDRLRQKTEEAKTTNRRKSISNIEAAKHSNINKGI